MDGFINLLKPSGMTSSDAVMAVRRLLPRKTPVGHGGTLDPDAAGVLPICVGKATRLFDYIIDKEKAYIGELFLGTRTDTLDASGKVLATQAVNAGHAELEACLKAFTGDIMQVPPVYSALKKGGDPLYRIARSGGEVKLSPRKVHITSLEILDQLAVNRFLMKIICGKGVYIRSLMRDIGDSLGCGGCMSFLIRTDAGALNIRSALSLDRLALMDDLSDALLPPDSMLQVFPKAVVGADRLSNVLNGQRIQPNWLREPSVFREQTVRLYVGNTFAGMGSMDADGSIQIKAMLLNRHSHKNSCNSGISMLK